MTRFFARNGAFGSCITHSLVEYVNFFREIANSADISKRVCYNKDNYSVKLGGDRMVYEKSCGAIVFRKFHGNVELLLIKHANGGHWSFPKGHVEQGESEVETAMREIKEETGIDVIVDPTFREVVSYSPKREIMKDVIYFIAKAKTHDYVPQEEEISEIKWVELGRVHTLLTYDNDKQLVNKAKPFLKDSFS